MRSKESRHAILSTVIALAGAAFLITVTAAAQNSSSHPGDVIRTVPPAVSQNVSPPPLNLTDDQRAKIEQVLATHNTQVTFALKTTQSARGFNPAVGEASTQFEDLHTTAVADLSNAEAQALHLSEIERPGANCEPDERQDPRSLKPKNATTLLIHWRRAAHRFRKSGRLAHSQD